MRRVHRGGSADDRENLRGGLENDPASRRLLSDLGCREIADRASNRVVIPFRREREWLSGADEGDRAAHQLQQAGALQVPLDLVAAHADLPLRCAGGKLAAGDVIERGAK